MLPPDRVSAYTTGHARSLWQPVSDMMRLPSPTIRNALIVAHDALATAVALLGSFYLHFEGELLTDRLPLLFRILPWFVGFSVVVCYLCLLYTSPSPRD